MNMKDVKSIGARIAAGGKGKSLPAIDAVAIRELAELDRLGVMHQNFGHRAAARAEDRVHRLHRLDDQKRIAFLDLIAHLHEGRFAGLRSNVDGTDHRRGDGAGLRAFWH